MDDLSSKVVGKEVCGIVMPISSIDNCSEAHWAEVRSIITEAIEFAGFSANLVSDADDIGVIQKRIIQNLYDNPIVVCDVSGKNPNVMFELGVRLAFDKPAIIIKDDKTPYSFDTSSIEHLEYPRDLRFSRIVDFKKKLSEKIKATLDKSKNDPDYTTFLKQFGQFKVAKLDEKEVGAQEFIIDELRGIKEHLTKLDKYRRIEGKVFIDREYFDDTTVLFKTGGWSGSRTSRILSLINSYPGVTRAELVKRNGATYIMVSCDDANVIEKVKHLISPAYPLDEEEKTI